MNQDVQQLKGKVAWITGASGGIGAALAIALSKLEVKLIISARNTENLDKVKYTCTHPDQVHILPADLAAMDTLPDVAERAWKIYNGIDYIILNAGFAVRDRIINTDLELIKKVMDVNFFSAVVLTKTLLPLMKTKGSGHFVVTSSLSGKYGIPQLGAYAASKHALHGFFESLRAEHENDHLFVTMVIPGLIRTNITLHAFKGDGTKYGKMQESLANGISAETCAQRIIKAMAYRKKEVLIGGLEIYSVWVKRMFPDLFSYFITRHPVKKLRKLGLFKARAT